MFPGFCLLAAKLYNSPGRYHVFGTGGEVYIASYGETAYVKLQNFCEEL